MCPGVYSRHHHFLSRNIQPAWPVGMNGSAARAARENNPINLKSRDNMPDIIKHDHDKDGVDRRGFLKCMAWAGTGVLWTMTGGILKSQTLSRPPDAAALAAGTDLSFVQISDSHIGFNKEANKANKDVAATLRKAVGKINALPKAPSRPQPSSRRSGPGPILGLGLG